MEISLDNDDGDEHTPIVLDETPIILDETPDISIDTVRFSFFQLFDSI
jgi:hypothetical protein